MEIQNQKSKIENQSKKLLARIKICAKQSTDTQEHHKDSNLGYLPSDKSVGHAVRTREEMIGND